jgi:hypothetical protein
MRASLSTNNEIFGDCGKSGKSRVFGEIGGVEM